ncbi:MAG: hypothetical protein A2Z72_04265 [Omnitrophica bacterium RBG_13_46_9]|nr:MAG: hypothetical protein A2Z72_04265 [Omnitrophica bacterium RBG_13_46_9]
MEKLDICLSEPALNDYLAGGVSEEKKAQIESHLKDCDYCLEKVVFAYQSVNEFNKKRRKGVKAMGPDWKKNLWLIGAVLAFVLSFFVRPFFIQFLAASILLGVKWIFDSVNARILIMIYEAWKKGGEKETSKIFRDFRER